MSRVEVTVRNGHGMPGSAPLGADAISLLLHYHCRDCGDFPRLTRIKKTGLQTRLRLVDRRQRHARGVFIKVWGYKHRTPNSRPRTLKGTSNGYHSLQCAGSLRETQSHQLRSPAKLSACLERPATGSRLIISALCTLTTMLQVHLMSNTDMHFVGFGERLCGYPFGRRWRSKRESDRSSLHHVAVDVHCHGTDHVIMRAYPLQITTGYYLRSRATPLSSHQPYCKGRVAAKPASAGVGCSK